MNCTSGNFFITAAISQSGFIVPVLVSLWISVIASNSPVASFASIASARIGWPHSTCSASACLPHFLATSNHLSENAPLMQLSTFLRDEIADRTFHHAPGGAGADEDRLLGVKELLQAGLDGGVQCLEIDFERCPIIGRENARIVFSDTSTGPGANSLM